MILSSAATVSLSFVLGLRHGLDADHLAAIDGLTRCNASASRRIAPYCGALFSAGHAGIILLAAVVLALVAGRWNPPIWLATSGTLISAGTLVLLGCMNLHAAFASSAAMGAFPFGLRSRLFASILQAPRWWQVPLVGALFAISFDAAALATVFAASATEWIGVVGIALAFAAGMLLVGAANGLWVVRLLRHSGDSNPIARRVMTLTIGIVSLLVGGCVLLPVFFSPLDRWLEAYELLVSGLVVTLVLAGYFLSLFFAHRARHGRRPEFTGTPDILNG